MGISFSNISLDGTVLEPEEMGRLHISRERFWPRHRHNEWKLNVVEEGTAKYLLADRCYDLVPGSVAWILPGQYHTFVDASPDYAHWVVVCRRVLLEPLAPEADAAPLWSSGDVVTGGLCRVLSPHDAKTLSDLLRQVATIPVTDAARLRTGLSYALVTVWSLFGQAPRRDGDVLHPAVRRVVALLRDPDTENQPLDVMAKAARISTGQLSRLFREQTGFSVPGFRSGERLRRFHRLMAQTPPPTLLHAALDSGFGSYVQFFRVFKAQMGRSPGQAFTP